MNAVSLLLVSETVAELQWSSNTSNDMIADSALALLMGIDASPATVKRESTETKTPLSHAVTSSPHPHSHSHTHPRINGDTNGDTHTQDGFSAFQMFLTAHFGDVSIPQKDMTDGDENDDLMMIDVNVDGMTACVDLISMVCLPQVDYADD